MVDISPRRRKIIAIVNGYPRSGKDTFVRYASERLQQLGWRTQAISSVDMPKDITRDCGIPDEPKTPEKRALWADLKQAFEKYDRFITRSTMAGAQRRMFEFSFLKQITFIYVREPEAIAFMKDLRDDCEFITIFLDRADADRVTSNSSDMNVENYQYGLTVSNNDDLADLASSAFTFAETVDAGQGPTS